MALEGNIVKRKGSWIDYKGETQAKGKEGTAEYLQEHPELMDEIKRDVMAKVREANGLVLEPETPAGMPDALLSEEALAESLLEEGAIALDLDLPLPDEEESE